MTATGTDEGKYAIRTASGRLTHFDRLEEMPVPTIHEIASHLSKEQRFGGAARSFYSVAQHAVLVSRLVERELGPFEALYALHHDDHEFLVKDIPTPFKRYLAARSSVDVLGEVVDQIDEVIYGTMLNLEYPIPSHIQEAIDRADIMMYVTEGQALIRNFQPPEGIPAADFTITPMTAEAAEQVYLQRHAQLTTRRGRRVA